MVSKMGLTVRMGMGSDSRESVDARRDAHSARNELAWAHLRDGHELTLPGLQRRPVHGTVKVRCVRG